MPIVDAHIHLWSHDLDRYPDIARREDGESRLPKVDGQADRIVARLSASGAAVGPKCRGLRQRHS